MEAKRTKMIHRLFLYIFLSCVLAFGAISILGSGGGSGGGESSTGNATGNTGTDGETANPPSPPTGVIAIGGEGEITLSWESVTDADSYTIYWSATSGVTKLQCTMILNITSTSYTHTGLTSGVTYYYLVTAVSSSGESDESSEVSATPTGANSWATITLDNNEDAGADNSIAIDSTDGVHISYYDVTNDSLRYATNASGSWVFETIDSEGVRGYTSIAVDSNDKVHISYAGTDGLRYATNASGSWVTSTIDSVGDVGYYTSIAVDSNNVVHISYYDLGNKDLKYATNASGDWVSETIDSVGDVGLFNSIGVDSNDKVHISYNGNLGALGYATNASGDWVLESILTVDNGYYRTSLAVDSSDHIHICYHDSTNDILGYATNASDDWAFETIKSFGESLYGYNSIALDSADHVHISYYDDDSSSLTYTTNASGSWAPYEIDSFGGSQPHNSIALDSNDCVHISYYNNTYLKYATSCAGTLTPSFPAPTGVEANAGEGYIALSWLTIPEAIGYNIYWATSSGVSTTTYEGKISCVTTTSYTHTDLADNTYYYVVTAETIYGEGDASEEVNAVPYTGTGDGGGGGGGSGCPTYSDLCYCDADGCSYGGTVLASCGCPDGTSQYGAPIYLNGVEYLQCVCD